MQKTISVLALLSLTSLGACAMTPEEMASMQGQLDSMNHSAQAWTAQSQQAQQVNQQIFQQTQDANREWTQQQADGTTVRCIKVGIYISCK